MYSNKHLGILRLLLTKSKKRERERERESKGMEGSEIRWGLVWAEADRRHQLHPLFLPHFYCTYNMKYELMNMNMNMIPDNKTSLNYTFLFSMSPPHHQSLLIPWHRGELSSYCNIGHSPPNDCLIWSTQINVVTL